jgi:hypothetical protein
MSNYRNTKTGLVINVKVISIRVAVACFFTVGIIGWINNIDPIVCCKRSATAMICGYIAAAAGAKFVNFIMSLTPVNQQKEQ